MNKLNLLFTFCIALFSFAQAQTPPNAFNYSAVARNAAGQPIASATIGLQISILKTSTTGAVQYSENHTVNTDAFGLFNLAIGAGAVQTGSMIAINWGTDNYFIKIGMDVTGGTNFLTMGTTQLMSVPYALHAKTAETLVSGGTNTVGKTYIELFGDITNAQADSTLKADLGPNTQFVYITNTTKLTSVDLSSIKALMELSITANEVLTTVNASSLTRCTKNFEIRTNPLLATIQTDKITFLGDVNIIQNDKLTALNFPLLKKARNIDVSENPILSSFSAVLLTIAYDVNFEKNGLTNLNISAITTLSGDLNIRSNALLSTLNIGSLKTARSIYINSNGLTNLNISALTTMNGELEVYNNISLSSLNTSALNTTGRISIQNNASLTSLTASLLNSTGEISIRSNGLTSISFPGLTTMNGQLYISENASLTSLTASSLNTAKGINIEKNGLTSLNFPALTTLNGQLYISNNASMTSLSIPALTTISGELSLLDNTLMTSLTTPLLTTVGQLNSYYSIRIQKNGLTNLSFPALTTLNGEFSVLTNSSLTSLTAPLLNTVGTLTINSNGLSSLSFPALITLNGRLNISNNASMTSLSFPVLTSIKSGETISISSNILLNALNISSLSKIPSFYASQNKLSNITWAPQITSWSSINLSSNALPSSEINEILALVVSAGQSAYSGGTNTSLNLSQTTSAPPTGQGITDKATIVGWSINVYTN